jgi:tetratricopeptide (TPR) repeat protein
MVLGCLSIPCADGGTVTNVPPQAGELLKKAYQAVVDAELALADNQSLAAANSYRGALGIYERLKVDYPGWQTAMINNRVLECRKALAALESDPAQGQAAPPDNSRLQALLTELRTVQTTLAQESPSSADIKSRQMALEIGRLTEELSESVKVQQALQRKIVKLETKLEKVGGSSGGETNIQCRAVVAAVKGEAYRLMNTNEFVPAILLLMEAVELMPSESDLVVLLALANCRDGRYADAVKLLTPFDVWKPKNADALLTLGSAYMGLGEVGKARDVVEKTLALKPNSAEAHYNLAQILITVTPPDVPNAQDHYQRAIELGAPVDLEFENALRTAIIITRMKQRKGSTGQRQTREPKTSSGAVITPGMPTTGTP